MVSGICLAIKVWQAENAVLDRRKFFTPSHNQNLAILHENRMIRGKKEFISLANSVTQPPGPMNSCGLFFLQRCGVYLFY